ncbi:unnamed protein product [Paramecium primaurelia]|uniref:Uncharacterized protein n=1 Tax=Paramecium primaurelia TaxID=5886 RepID=A0A8S1KX83_PARPR|nr:unnamed protein product [Paramecium primaurelia]
MINQIKIRNNKKYKKSANYQMYINKIAKIIKNQFVDKNSCYILISSQICIIVNLIKNYIFEVIKKS